MPYNGPPPTARQQAEAKFAQTQQHDDMFFRERREREAANLAKTIELRNLRLAKEARDREDAKLNATTPAKAKRAKSRSKS